MAWRKPLPPSHNSKDLAADDLNGGALVMDEEDPELSRKKRELQEIEERIINKKAAIAVKTVEMFAKNMKSPGDEQSDLCKGKPLRDRVMEILKQRHPHGFSLKSSKGRLKPMTPRKHGLVQEHHPLKVRVTAAMKHRVGDHCVFPTSREVSDIPLTPSSQSFTSPVEDKGTKTGLGFLLQMLNKGTNVNVNTMVPEVPVPPPSQDTASLTKENDSVHHGFERFLNVLNKGVDVQMLNSIVNAAHPSSERSKPDSPLGSKSQGWNSEASPPGCSRTSSTELMLDLLSRKPFTPDAEEKKNDGRDQNVESSSQSACPLSEKKKEGGETAKADQKLEQLQSIVETLGLNLNMQELNRLTDRTQERLYGKKKQGRQRPDGRGKETRQSGSHKDYSKSRSSSSDSSSSRSCSRSLSRSSSSDRHSRDSRERRKRKRSRSSETRREGLKHGDRNEVGTEVEKHHYQDETYPPPHPAAFAHPHNLLQQQSYYTDCYSDSYRDATNCWTSNQNYSNAPSLYPCQQPVPDNSSLTHGETCPDPTREDHKGRALKWIPVSSVSKGQSEAVDKSSDHSLLQLTKHRVRRRKRKSKRVSFRNKKKKRALAAQHLCSTQAYGMEASYTVASKVVALQNDLQHLLDKESDEEKPQPTDEEIKANLRKKLQAFNQKAKQAKQLSNSEVNQPSNSQTSELG